MERYLIKYLKENNQDPIIRKYVDFFKVELDWFIYNYGNHISSTHKRGRNPLKRRINQLIQSFSPTSIAKKSALAENNILSSLHISDNWVKSLGIQVYSSIFQPVGRKNIIRNPESVSLLYRIHEAIRAGIFTDIYNSELFYRLEDNQHTVLKQYQQYNLSGLLLYTDQYFESKYLIDIFQKLSRPSMIISHGLPGIYSTDVDHRSDYLMVWGEKIKENYINLTGMSPDKIKVVGNPKYQSLRHFDSLRNSLEDVLVIPISSILWHQHEWSEPKLVDRSMIILYLNQVQRVLQSFGVKSARFRPHPAINSRWVYGFLDKNFYHIDTESLQTSFNRSSLVIGATSTTFLEALMNGVNYLIFEPQDSDGKDLLRSYKVPPFDGSEKDLEIAQNPEDLRNLIKSKYISTPKVLDGYIQPFDLSPIKEIIK